MNLIPPIGATGLYKLSNPFASIINTNISYTCMAVRKLSDVSAMGIDPFKVYYEPYGLTQQAYEEDLLNGICIISLQSNSGIWAYVPSSYLQGYPEVNGVPYASVALMVHLGALPDSLNLDYLKNKVKDDVQALLGVQPNVQTVVTSARTLVSQDNHRAAEQARQNNIETNQTDYSSIVALQSANAELRAKIAQLEAYILAHEKP